jgi:hypothetical protein
MNLGGRSPVYVEWEDISEETVYLQRLARVPAGRVEEGKVPGQEAIDLLWAGRVQPRGEKLQDTRLVVDLIDTS